MFTWGAPSSIGVVVIEGISYWGYCFFGVAVIGSIGYWEHWLFGVVGFGVPVIGVVIIEGIIMIIGVL